MSESVFAMGEKSGIGIDCEGATFRAVYVRGQRNKARVVDSLAIPEYRELGAAECGRRYREFLKKHGLQAPRTVVALPRQTTLLRVLEFPKTVEKELRQAVAYQVGSYSPWEDDSVYWDYAVWKWPQESAWGKLTAGAADAGEGKLEVLLGITQRKQVDEMAAWFDEAGIPVSEFNVKAALWVGMFWPRLQAMNPAELSKAQASTTRPSKTPAMFVLHALPGRAEFVGFMPGRDPVAWLDTVPDGDETQEAVEENVRRSLDAARSLMRIEPEQRSMLLVCGNREAAAVWLADAKMPFRTMPAEQVVPELASDAFDRENGWTALAAGVAAAQGGGLLPINLLPEAKRTYQPAGTNLPAYILAALVGLLALALGVRGPAQDWLYAQHLDREMEALRPQLRQLEAAQSSAEEAQRKLQALDGVRQSARGPLEILNELTRILPPDVWLQQFTYDGVTVSVTGNAPAASGLLQVLAASPYFDNPQFRTSISRSPEGQERFTISAQLRPGARAGMAEGGAR